MIFITVGSQKFQFNRLLKTIDSLIESGRITEPVFAQIGYSDYIPKNYDFRQFLDYEEFAELEEKADIVITHGGTGSIISAIKKGKRVIAVPRLVKYGEHVDDHQLQLIKEFQDKNIICGVNDCEDIGKALEYTYSHKFDIYKSNNKAFVESIDKFISKLKKGHENK